MRADLNLAQNFKGALNGETRARLVAVIDNPNPVTWDDAYSIILNPDIGMGLTLWQAILTLKHGHIPLTADVTEVPTREQIIQAISYATH